MKTWVGSAGKTEDESTSQIGQDSRNPTRQQLGPGIAGQREDGRGGSRRGAGVEGEQRRGERTALLAELAVDTELAVDAVLGRADAGPVAGAAAAAAGAAPPAKLAGRGQAGGSSSWRGVAAAVAGLAAAAVGGGAGPAAKGGEAEEAGWERSAEQTP